MKKTIVVFTLVLTIFTSQNSALAADFSVNEKPGFFRSFFNKVGSFFSSDSKTYITDNDARELGESQAQLLKLLNKYELAIRVGGSGRAIYLHRDEIIARLGSFKGSVEESSMEDATKDEVLSKIDNVLRVLNMDLVDSPQEKIVPQILSALDELEEMVFEISEEDANSILNLISSLDLPAVQDLAYSN